MAMVVLLFPPCDDQLTLQPPALQELARLGITSVSLLADEQVAGLVLEGWSFDPMRATDAARVAIGREGVRTLQPLMQMAISLPATPIAN
jgi:hypothetical protein